MDGTRLEQYNRIRGDVHTYSSTLTAEVSSQIAGDIEGFVNHPADECVDAQRETKPNMPFSAIVSLPFMV